MSFSAPGVEALGAVGALEAVEWADVAVPRDAVEVLGAAATLGAATADAVTVCSGAAGMGAVEKSNGNRARSDAGT